MRRSALFSAIAASLAIPTAADAVSTKWYGFINRAVQFVDDGAAADVSYVDNTAASSRMGWTGTADAGNGLITGAKVEYDFRSNTVFSTGGAINGADASDTAFRIRKAEVFVTGSWGKVTLGQTSDATDNVAFSFQNDAFEASRAAHDWGTVSFRGSNGAVLGATPFSFSSSFDGGRRDLVRYDTPSLGPFRGAVSAATNDRYDASIHLNTNIGSGSLIARAGYARVGGSRGPTVGSEAKRALGSLSYKFSQGTFVDLFFGTDDTGLATPLAPGGDDPYSWYVGIGQDWGNTTVLVDYMSGEDLTPGCEGERFGLGFVHKIPTPKVTLLAGYHNYSADCSTAVLTGSPAAGGFALPRGSDIEDINVVHAGARIAFD